MRILHNITSYTAIISFTVLFTACSNEPDKADPPELSTAVDTAAVDLSDQATMVTDSNREESQAVVLLRGLPTLGTNHSVAIVELAPDAENFGDILHEFEISDLQAPLHHL